MIVLVAAQAAFPICSDHETSAITLSAILTSPDPSREALKQLGHALLKVVDFEAEVGSRRREVWKPVVDMLLRVRQHDEAMFTAVKYAIYSFLTDEIGKKAWPSEAHRVAEVARIGRRLDRASRESWAQSRRAPHAGEEETGGLIKLPASPQLLHQQVLSPPWEMCLAVAFTGARPQMSIPATPVGWRRAGPPKLAYASPLRLPPPPAWLPASRKEAEGGPSLPGPRGRAAPTGRR